VERPPARVVGRDDEKRPRELVLDAALRALDGRPHRREVGEHLVDEGRRAAGAEERAAEVRRDGRPGKSSANT